MQQQDTVFVSTPNLPSLIESASPSGVCVHNSSLIEKSVQQLNKIEQVNNQQSKDDNPNSEFKSIHRHEEQQLTIHQEIKSADTLNALNLFNPPIPMSHLIATNQYPSLTTVPQNIAKSFTPIFIQPHQQSQSDIYNDYVNNPYNLVLQSDPNIKQTSDDSGIIDLRAETAVTAQLKQSGVNNVSNVFQSANYFGTDKSDVIPPGSEMLFSGP